MPKFVIHEHFAEKAGHHYDLRLELDEVAKSWVLRKEIPKRGEKRLAIQTFDHSIEYMNFEGEIKEGYGKGLVRIYDRGYYDLIERTDEKIKFRLHGEKIRGTFVLIRFPKVKNGWLLIRIE